MNHRNRLFALTFDDGPNDVYTPKLLDVLENHGVKATFFLIGKHVTKHREMVCRIHSAGHAIGNHTFTHQALVNQSQAVIYKELADCQKALEDVLGAHPGALFRPPFGGIDTATGLVAGFLSLVSVHWSVEAEDWVPKPAQAIANRIATIIDGRTQNEIILLHDGSPEYPPADRSASVQATDLLLERYRQEQRYVTLPELINGS